MYAHDIVSITCTHVACRHKISKIITIDTRALVQVMLCVVNQICEMVLNHLMPKSAMMKPL